MSEDPVRERLEYALTDGDVAVDVGANPRPTARVPIVEAMSDAVGERGLVVAFDPFPMKRMLAIADRENVVFVPDAVSHEPIALIESHATAGNWVSPLQRSYTGGVPLDAVVTAAVVKIDVEGYEWHVLRSAPRLIETVRPVWVIEVHPHKPKAESAVENSLGRLRTAGYDVFTVTESQPLEVEDLDTDGATNVIAIP